MFQLDVQAIHTQKEADDKYQVIAQVAAALCAAGNTAAGYEQGMLAREEQTTTYLGNGIAIPHGTPDTRDKVLKTGVQVYQYPRGIEWGEGQFAFLVIGIAAKSDEHLALLQQLTHVLSDDSLAETLKTASAEEIRAILMGEKLQAPYLLDRSMISLDIATGDLTTLKAINSSRLFAVNAVNSDYLVTSLAETPLHLGSGIWLNDSLTGNKLNALAISRLKTPATTSEGIPVRLLLTVSAIDETPQKTLDYLMSLLNAGRAEELFSADASGLLTLLSSDIAPSTNAITEDFIIRNEHGLHARPGTILVSIIKQFDCDVSITNLDGSGKPANGRSLMKVVALGVKRGHRLRITVNGEQAESLMTAIRNGVESGLGEGPI